MTIIKILSAHKKTLLWLALCWTAIVTYFCLVSFDKIPSIGIKSFDKIGHFIFHFGLTLVWFLFFKFKKNNLINKAVMRSFLFSLIYGITIELIQTYLTDSRKGDINDVFANMTGAITAVSLIYFGDAIRRRNF